MFNDIGFWLPALLVLIVLAILLFGVGTFAKGGEFHRRNSNRIMRWRLYAQFFAVVVIVAFAWWHAQAPL